MFLVSRSTNFCGLLYFGCVVLLRLAGCAQDVQTRAQAMLQRARQLSDIRSDGAVAFRLKAKFQTVGEDLETVQGSYTEIWVSRSQWRREVVVGDFRQIDIGSSGKRWLLYPDGFPERANQLVALMTPLPPATTPLEFASFAEPQDGGVKTDCALTKPMLHNLKAAFCFDKETGLLLEKFFPERRPRNVVSFSCGYGTFHKFGELWFPYEVTCWEDRHQTISASVTELTLYSPVDASLFVAPAGAIELGDCSGKTVSPILSTNTFALPVLDLERVAWINLWFVVDVKGRPQNIRILKGANKDSHKDTLRRVQDWRFHPGTCDGQPIPMTMTMEVPSAPR